VARFICPDDFPNQNKRKLPDERSNAFARHLISKLLISQIRYDTIEENLVYQNKRNSRTNAAMHLPGI